MGRGAKAGVAVTRQVLEGLAALTSCGLLTVDDPLRGVDVVSPDVPGLDVVGHDQEAAEQIPVAAQWRAQFCVFKRSFPRNRRSFS
jgi:hypothetical protein